MGVSLLILGLLMPGFTLGDSFQSTVYVNKFFEVRGHEQPIKYVFNGNQRVATVTGSLSGSQRVQRLHLHPGWNLRSLAVQGVTLPVAGSSAGADGIVAAYRLDEVTGQWLPVSASEMLSAGAILWIFVNGHPTLGLRGGYEGVSDATVAAGKGFLATGGLEPRAAPAAEGGVELWGYDGMEQDWQVRAAGLPESGDDLPLVLAPGEAVFLSNGSPIEWAAPEAALSVRFSHPDHLRSSAVVTDAGGGLVEETTFHPFGPVRSQLRLRSVEEAYKYTQKERDQESGLHYYEARYLAASLARFSRPDTKYAAIDSLSKAELDSLLANPQAINPYAYVLNNPIKFIDPQGEDAVKPRTDQVSYTLTLKPAHGDPVDIPIAAVSVVRGGSSKQVRDAPTEIYITRQTDRRSAELLRDLTSGKVFDEATVTVRGPGKSRDELSRLRLTHVTVSYHHPTSGGEYVLRPQDNIAISGVVSADAPSPAAAPAAPAEPQATRGGNPFAPPPAFDVDKAAKQTAKDFQEILSGSSSK